MVTFLSLTIIIILYSFRFIKISNVEPEIEKKKTIIFFVCLSLFLGREESICRLFVGNALKSLFNDEKPFKPKIFPLS